MNELTLLFGNDNNFYATTKFEKKRKTNVI